MIIVQSTFHLVPEARNDAIKQMQHMAALCVDEPGCLSYEYFQGVTDTNQVVLLQEWKNSACLRAHYQTKHMEEFVSQLDQFLESPVSTRSFVSQDERISHVSEDEPSKADRVVH